MGVAHAVVTAVARDDLDDGGASAFVATIDAIRAQTPGVAVEVLIPDCKGEPERVGCDLRRASRCAEPQRRDGAAPATSRAPVSWLRPQPRPARPREGFRSRHEVGDHRRHGGDRRRGGRHARRPACGRGRHRHDRPVLAADDPSPSGRPMGSACFVRAVPPRGRAARDRARRGLAAHPLQLPRPRAAAAAAQPFAAPGRTVSA